MAGYMGEKGKIGVGILVALVTGIIFFSLSLPIQAKTLSMMGIFKGPSEDGRGISVSVRERGEMVSKEFELSARIVVEREGGEAIGLDEIEPGYGVKVYYQKVEEKKLAGE